MSGGGVGGGGGGGGGGSADCSIASITALSFATLIALNIDGGGGGRASGGLNDFVIHSNCLRINT